MFAKFFALFALVAVAFAAPNPKPAPAPAPQLFTYGLDYGYAGAAVPSVYSAAYPAAVPSVYSAYPAPAYYYR